jgi:hypothetical protein
MVTEISLPGKADLASVSVSATRDPYLVKSVVHASAILAVFTDVSEALTLKEVVMRSHLPKSMVFRLLYTMEHCALIEKAGKNLYRLPARARAA